jgi:hypothetical protein
MATWFTVIDRIAQFIGIPDALVEFEERESEFSSCRRLYVAFWGDLLKSGRSYVIFGTWRE